MILQEFRVLIKVDEPLPAMTITRALKPFMARKGSVRVTSVSRKALLIDLPEQPTK